MSINPNLPGTQYPPTQPYLVGREKIREFARAVHSEHAFFVDPAAARAAGYADVIAPTTFPVIIQEQALQLLLADPEAGVDFARVVHGSQQFVHSRAIVAGDELRGTLTVSSVKQLGGHSMLSSETVIVDAADAHVVTATSLLIVRGED